jgi:hypothetical protein
LTDNSWWNYPASASPVNYTSNAANQYTAVGAATPTYDANGNLTSTESDPSHAGMVHHVAAVCSRSVG